MAYYTGPATIEILPADDSKLGSSVNVYADVWGHPYDEVTGERSSWGGTFGGAMDDLHALNSVHQAAAEHRMVLDNDQRAGNILLTNLGVVSGRVRGEFRGTGPLPT